MTRPSHISDVMLAACEASGCTLDEMRSNRRTPRIVLAREVCIVLARELTNFSFPELARLMGRPNHSSVITTRRRALAALDSRPTLATDGPTRREAIETARAMVLRASEGEP